MNTNTFGRTGPENRNEAGLVDVVVVGAGIIGLAVAREILARYPDFTISILEKEAAVSKHQTGHNSGVIHSGIYYTPGSLKARLCVEGARLMYEYCEVNDLPFERVGKLIIARKTSEIPALRDLHQRGITNGVQDLRWLEGHEISEVEPLGVGVAALHSPNTGIVDYPAVCRQIEQDLRAAGVQFHFKANVSALTRSGDITTVESEGRPVARARWVITCAGLWSDEIAVASGADKNPRIIPFRGAYLHFAPTDAPDVVKGMIYPVPDPTLPFLGVHVTKHIDGGISIGPTAFVAGAKDAYQITRIRVRDLWSMAAWPGLWRVALKYWRTAFTEFRMLVSRRAFQRAAAEYVPEIAHRSLEKRGSAGVRAQAVDRDGTLVDDFVISEVPGATHIRNAPSPAATSAFALAIELVNRTEQRFASH